jgi:large subunit ribosomal protein L29
MKEIAKLSESDLKKLVLKNKEELFKLRFQKAGGQAPNTARFKQLRKTTARALYALGQLKSKV